MKKHLLTGGLATFAMCAGLVVACGDDDDAKTTQSSPDGGPQQQPTTDSGTPPKEDGGDTPDSGGDAGETTTPVTALTTTRLPNAINPYGLVFGSDGNLYAAGATIDPVDLTRKLAVWRFKNGALDATFGADGVLIADDIPGDESAWDMVEVSPGNFVIEASASGKIFLVKLTRDVGGAFAFAAPTFVRFGYDEDEAWPAGMPTTPATPPSYSTWGIGLDKSNASSPKIVVFAAGAPAKAADPATQRTDNDRWITRVDATTLAFDTTFNGGAPYTVDADGKGLADNARRGVVLDDGSIVSSGYTNFGTGLGNHVVLIRLQKTGAVDPAFGFGTAAPGIPGQTKFNPFVASGGFAEAYGVVRQSGGRYVTTGYGTSNFTVPSKSVDLVVFGVKTDGLDTAFGKLGSFAWQSETSGAAGLGTSPYEDRGRDIAVLADDRTVHVGLHDSVASIFVLGKDGAPDKASGNGGILEYNHPTAFFKVATSADKKQIAATTQSALLPTDAGAPLASLVATLKVGP